MKIVRILFSALLVGSLLVYSSCGDDDGPGQSQQELATTQLAQQWTPSDGTVSGPQGLVTFPGPFTLTFNADGTFTSSGSTPDGYAGPLFATSGNWEWANETTTTDLVLGPNNDAVTVAVTDNSLNLSFSIDPATQRPIGSSRVNSVGGSWTVSVSEQ
jgi:hypothetical protein